MIYVYHISDEVFWGGNRLELPRKLARSGRFQGALGPKTGSNYGGYRRTK